MRLWPRTLTGRLVVVLGSAAGVLLALDYVVQANDARVRQRQQAVIERRAIEPEVAAPIRLPVVRGLVRLALHTEAAPSDGAPVVQVLAGGDYAIRRPPPRPGGPEQEHSLSPVVVLPGPPSQLDPAARATLAAVIGALVGERPVAAGRFFTLDFQLEVQELQRLLSWVR